MIMFVIVIIIMFVVVSPVLEESALFPSFAITKIK